MKAGVAKLAVQEALGIPAAKRAQNIGPLTREAFERLAVTPNDSEWNAPAASAHRMISADGISLVKHFEGLYLEAYKDEVGVWTIGYGHTGLQHRDGTVFHGRKITKEEAEQLLRYDMRQFEERVSALVNVPLNDDQFSALVSFDFNTGGLAKSTLLKRLNDGMYQVAADQFLLWDKAGGRSLRGLTRRRHSERNLFLSIRPFIVSET